jgi:hypothetical protein
MDRTVFTLDEDLDEPATLCAICSNYIGNLVQIGTGKVKRLASGMGGRILAYAGFDAATSIFGRQHLIPYSMP